MCEDPAVARNLPRWPTAERAVVKLEPLATVAAIERSVQFELVADTGASALAAALQGSQLKTLDLGEYLNESHLTGLN